MVKTAGSCIGALSWIWEIHFWGGIATFISTVTPSLQQLTVVIFGSGTAQTNT